LIEDREEHAYFSTAPYFWYVVAILILFGVIPANSQVFTHCPGLTLQLTGQIKRVLSYNESIFRGVDVAQPARVGTPVDDLPIVVYRLEAFEGSGFCL